MRLLDNRGLQPPEPMVRVLQALEENPRECLEVLNDRPPLFLYPILEERGYRWETEEQADGSVRIRISPATTSPSPPLQLDKDSFR
jgi:tRNA 2-thiouridine synthesizing protein A